MSETGPELPGLRFIEKLGAGGFSDVYLYERDSPRLKVAVKLMRSDVLDDAQRRQFAAEADAMAELAEHPYIVPVLGAGTSPDGRPYLVMRYYPPPDLGARVKNEPLTVAEALRTGIQLASAIETAHRAGIIHRDIKPANILVSSYGSPGLSDFGIAGRAADTDDDEHLGVSMPWSPPEVLTGASNGSVTSDVYSFGATIWNLLVGRSPYVIRNGDNSERALFGRIVHSKPPSTGRADVPGSLDRLLQQCLAKEPEHRPQSAMEVARHLQRVEQELRLSRTEIEVLDSTPEVRSSPASFAPRPAPVELPAVPSAPSGLVDSAPRKTIPTETSPLDFSPPAGATQRRQVARVEPQEPPAGATQRRQVTRFEPAPAVPAAAVPIPAPATPVPGATVQRTVQRVAPGTVDPPATTAPAPRRGRAIALVAVAALLVSAVGGGILLNRGGDEDPTSSLPNGSGADGLEGLGLDTAPSVPIVRGKVKGDQLVFTWSAEQDEDFYRYTVSRSGKTAQVDGPKVSLPRGSGQVCLTVVAYRGEKLSDPSNEACAGG